MQSLLYERRESGVFGVCVPVLELRCIASLFVLTAPHALASPVGVVHGQGRVRVERGDGGVRLGINVRPWLASAVLGSAVARTTLSRPAETGTRDICCLC